MPRFVEIIRSYIFTILIGFFISSCALFVTHYDATAYQYFTSLKAYHLKFLDDFTANDNKIWDETALNNACDTGELRFREAIEYATGKKDESRVHAFEYLHNAFKSQCQLSIRTKKLFSKTYVEEQKKDVAANYDWAISGEVSRVGAPIK